MDAHVSRNSWTVPLHAEQLQCPFGLIVELEARKVWSMMMHDVIGDLHLQRAVSLATTSSIILKELQDSASHTACTIVHDAASFFLVHTNAKIQDTS